MKLLDTIFKQRAYDGKWIALSKVLDPENAYVYFNDLKQKISLIPEKWIITGVYDYEIEIAVK